MPPVILRLLIPLISLFILAGAPSAAELRIPLTIHLVDDLIITKDGLSLRNWVTSSDIKTQVLTEVNRIWKPASITFYIKGISTHASLQPEDRKRRLEYLAAAHRDADGTSDRQRIKQLDGLIDWSQHDPSSINVYWVPYLGETSQGNASPKKRRIYMGQWSDKPSRGTRPPQRRKLVELGPLEEGSLGRTLAHEIGHILGLKHPEKSRQKVFSRLMGGKQAGYGLTDKEIQKARQKASQW